MVGLQKSSLLIWVAIILLVFLGIGGVYTIHLTATIGPDAQTINQLGVIRGSIQRLVKLEIANVQSDGLSASIDENIVQFSSRGFNNSSPASAIGEVTSTWTRLKDKIQQFRDNSSTQNQQQMLALSEEIWGMTNDMVLSSQLASEKRLALYRFSYIFVGTSLLLTVYLIYIINQYVKNKLETLVNYDALTKLYNRGFFNGTLERQIATAKRYQQPFSLIFFDIDHFKNVNDTYGHKVGDKILQSLSKLVQDHVRKSDVLARIGGEEFAIIAPQTELANGYQLAEKIRRLVEEFTFEEVKDVSISLGVTQYSPGDDSDLIFNRADEALYQAKNEGRNRSVAIAAHKS